MTCFCGCGQTPAKASSLFCPGHNQRMDDEDTARRHVDWANDMRKRVQRGTSKLEEFMATRLSKGYKRHVRIEGYKFDFCHQRRKKLIEVNGCWFHSCPTCHPSGALASVQKRVKMNDAKKATAAKAAGYSIRYVWEHELKPKMVGGGGRR